MTRNTTKDPRELATALSELCSAIAATNPAESLALAEEIDTAVVEKDKHLQAYVADARHIAYLSLGDEMRATHHRAVAISIRRELGEVSWQGLMAALRSAVTPLANSKKEIIELPDTLDVWLANRRRISLADLVPRFGEFISNDLEFYREVTDRFDKLVMRLKVGLNKPDNYLLLADPGSGKSFFVKEFARLLKERLNKHPDVYFFGTQFIDLSEYRRGIHRYC